MAGNARSQNNHSRHLPPPFWLWTSAGGVLSGSEFRAAHERMLLPRSLNLTGRHVKQRHGHLTRGIPGIGGVCSQPCAPSPALPSTTLSCRQSSGPRWCLSKRPVTRADLFECLNEWLEPLGLLKKIEGVDGMFGPHPGTVPWSSFTRPARSRRRLKQKAPAGTRGGANRCSPVGSVTRAGPYPCLAL